MLLEALTELGVVHFRITRMIRSLEKNKDRLGLLPQKKQKEMCIRETGSGRKVQVLRLLTWENNRT